MRINWKVVSGILAAGLVYDGYVGHKNRQKFDRIKAERAEAMDLSNLHASMLRKHHICYDEFEKIVSSQLLQDYKLPN